MHIFTNRWLADKKEFQHAEIFYIPEVDTELRFQFTTKSGRPG